MMPCIEDLMEKQPHTIGKDIPLSKAKEMMLEFHIRHLPVQYGGKTVGVLSERDIHLALSLSPTSQDLKVEDVMTEDPYAALGKTPAEEVLRQMARNRYGCSVIVDERGRCIGIFTATDAVRLLADKVNLATGRT